MSALPTDVARSRVSTYRQAFETVFKAMVSVLERSTAGHGAPRRVQAQALAALCVGVDGGGAGHGRPRLCGLKLRDACMGVALELGGWTNARKLKNGDLKRMQRVRAAAS